MTGPSDDGDEIVLQDRADRPVVRIGDTVRHRPHPWSPAIRELLLHLESVGFDRAPRFLGIDDAGRDVLSHLPGDAGAAAWERVADVRGLRNFAALLRDFHRAVRGFRPSTPFAPAPDTAAGPDVLVCHGDPGPWNVAWDGLRPVGLFDWEYAVVAPSRYDLGYALGWCVPFRDDETTLTWHHFDAVPDRPARIAAFAAAYGLPEVTGLVDAALDAQRFTLQRIRLLAAAGAQRQRALVDSGDLAADEQRLDWAERHRTLFVAG